jgi:apolipoprotein N-acyltransferase
MIDDSIDKNNKDEQLKDLHAEALAQRASRSGNEAWIVSRKRTLLHFVIVIVSALLFSASFPPFKYSFLAWCSIFPLILVVRNRSLLQAFGFGYLWGYFWSLTTFMWFREIEFVLPFIGGFYFALYPAIWSMMIPILQKSILGRNLNSTLTKANVERVLPKRYWLKEVMFTFALASLWCVLEWVRGWMISGFSWNFAGVSQWQNLPVIQICEYTGIYGISFLLIFFNASLISVVDGVSKSIKVGKYSRPFPLLVAVVLLMGTVLLGVNAMMKYSVIDSDDSKILKSKDYTQLAVVLIQANIPQCRNPKIGEADFALEQYVKLSQLAVTLKPDLVIWPETAVPIPYFSGHNFGAKYRFELSKLQKESGVPLLFGTIDFGSNVDKYSSPEDVPVYNGALLLDGNNRVVERYFKQHLVPFGEYTPLGEYYPIVKKYFGMGRDLTAGKRYTLFDLKDGVKAGVQICFEDIFPYISRGFVLRGANLLIVLSNDAWYPNSSESEQHMANSIFRAIENRRPLIRSGNNNCSCLILPNGAIVDTVSVKEDEFGNMVLAPEVATRGYAEFKATIEENPPLTFYTKFGDVFLLFCGVITIFAILNAMWSWREKKDKSIAKFADQK